MLEVVPMVHVVLFERFSGATSRPPSLLMGPWSWFGSPFDILMKSVVSL